MRRLALSTAALAVLALAALGQGQTLYALAGMPVSGIRAGYRPSPGWSGAWLYAVEGPRLALVRQLIAPPSGPWMPPPGPGRNAWVNGGLFGVLADGADDLFVVGPRWLIRDSALIEVVRQSAPGLRIESRVDTPLAAPLYDDGVLAYVESGGTGLLQFIRLARGATRTRPAEFAIVSIFASPGLGVRQTPASTFPRFAPFFYSGNGEPAWSTQAQVCQMEEGAVGLLNLGVPRDPATEFPLVPLPPMLPASVKRGVDGKTAGAGGIIIASDLHFFIFSLAPPLVNHQVVDFGPVLAYVYDRQRKSWTTLRLPTPAAGPASRIFGDWLATPVVLKRTAPLNPEELPRNWGRYSPNPFLYDTRLTDQIQLNNLADGRVITMHTGAEGSEVLDINASGQMLYRVNDEILEAQIEGNKVGPAKMLVKDEHVPEVNWVFWSRAKPPAAAAKGAN